MAQRGTVAPAVLEALVERLIHDWSAPHFPSGEPPDTDTDHHPPMARHQYATQPPNIRTMPPGIPFIIGNEAAERFSFYGMRSILILFMTHYLVTRTGAPDQMSEVEARQNLAFFI